MSSLGTLRSSVRTTNRRSVTRRPSANDTGVHRQVHRSHNGPQSRAVNRPGRRVAKRCALLCMGAQPSDEHLVDVFGLAGGGIEETLSEIAAEVLERPVLADSLHPLGNHSQPSRVRKHNDGGDDRPYSRLADEIGNERLVDLDEVEREPL